MQPLWCHWLGCSVPPALFTATKPYSLTQPEWPNAQAATDTTCATKPNMCHRAQLLLVAAFIHSTLTHHHTCPPLNHPNLPFQPQAQDAAEQISCRVHVVNNTGSPDNNLQGHVRSSLKVLAAADIQDVSVILQVQHPDVAALEVSGGGWYEDSEGKGWAKGARDRIFITEGFYWTIQHPPGFTSLTVSSPRPQNKS